jgi:hypothetical protein
MRTNACAAASNVGCDENLGPAALAASWATGAERYALAPGFGARSLGYERVRPLNT